MADSTVAVGSSVLATVDFGIACSSIEDSGTAVDTVGDVAGGIGLCFASDLPCFPDRDIGPVKVRSSVRVLVFL